ncbi:hypothetical protein A9K65_013900 [Mesorhizobium sp. WSM1497]|nr:hypothetical protein A9K65_013900 [Mesorhizobium sp. WSM1497]
MAISNALRDEYLEIMCPNCSTVTLKKGSWVKTTSNFTCERCGSRVRIGYLAKVALFEQKMKSMNPSAR